MRFLVLTAIALYLPLQDAHAQKKTTGDIISENYNRGRQMREAMDARREQANERERHEDEARREAILLSDRREVALAKNNPSFILRSLNNLPEIRISDSPVDVCGTEAKAAFTVTAKGESVFGCATFLGPLLEVDWAEYGKRTYTLTEWERIPVGNADQVPLGT